MTAKMDLVGKRYGSLVVMREIDIDKFFCVCKPTKGRCAKLGGSSREVTRDQLTGMAITSCKACSDHNRKTLNRERPMPVAVEPLVKIELPPCIGCVVRTIRGVRYRAIQPDCKLHSSMYGGISEGYARSTLTASSSIGGGRAIYSHRKAGMANE